MIKKGDTIKVLMGKDKGKMAKVLRIVNKKGKVLVEGVNSYKKHERARQKGKKGQVIERVMPIDISNVLLYCEKCKKGVRIGILASAKGKKSRVCKSCGLNI